MRPRSLSKHDTTQERIRRGISQQRGWGLVEYEGRGERKKLNGRRKMIDKVKTFGNFIHSGEFIALQFFFFLNLYLSDRKKIFELLNPSARITRTKRLRFFATNLDNLTYLQLIGNVLSRFHMKFSARE